MVKSPEAIRVSTLLGLAVMDAVEAGARNGAIMMHGLSPELRERIAARLAVEGWTRKEVPANGGEVSMHAPDSGWYVSMWCR